MLAWQVATPGPIDTGPLEFVELPLPEPGPGQIRVRITTCGVCRTDLHVAEGDLAPKRPRIVPGHEVVGVVERAGPGCTRFAARGPGRDRVVARGVRDVRLLSSRARKSCPNARFTGWDHDGGYAERTVVREDFAYAIPATIDDEHAAPLLCAGIIGYRAIKRAEVRPGATVGLYGFGGSAHLAIQVLKHGAAACS